MRVFEYYSDREQDMIAEGRILEEEAAMPTAGRCRACLDQSTTLDSDGLCARCEHQPARTELLQLLAPLQLTGSAQGNLKWANE